MPYAAILLTTASLNVKTGAMDSVVLALAEVASGLLGSAASCQQFPTIEEKHQQANMKSDEIFCIPETRKDNQGLMIVKATV